LSFEVLPGRVTGFLGPNGAGKSTTMRMTLGLDAPTAGQVTVNGFPNSLCRYPLHEVGALLDARAFHGGRSAYNHLLCLAQSNRITRQRVEEVIGLVGLNDVARRRAGGFSLGGPLCRPARSRGSRRTRYYVRVRHRNDPEHSSRRPATPSVLVANGISLMAPVYVVSTSPWGRDISKYLPGDAGQAIFKVHGTAGMLSPWTGLAVLSAWTAAALGLSAWLTTHRDA
jgi:hypothetical protein